ncbi:MAG: bifunctional adenosylcobinamide kinase/adenosylcobinamide-phosphate guanylyltransferase [Candidatus Desulforudis sp.]|nr:bifunctional adenosylcobinamide kinase/adenosylcobinamide-phosphate guanylyltransferase [Desulforudis sp.]MBV1734223.1 bifunctional adenosylcobinamide kinase/adenosylcobinamide-phosphate guanylyltransferase [Desulforudis sp.]MBV1769469.1 bifunctional adenosylcobinamide kinase/adenosylcobinamide-phosphate guanylyltransferase [Desulforudis sp.]
MSRKSCLSPFPARREAKVLVVSAGQISERDKPEVMLVLGGTRSGKSDWALRYVEGRYRAPLYLATAEARDAEMAERIARHRRERGPGWGLVEEPREIVPILARGGRREADAVLVDCLTMWLTNILLTEGGPAADRGIDELCTALREPGCPLVLVSNEVGMGIVPDSTLGREFRDLAGMLNQRVAALSDRVVFVAAGLPLVLK